MTSSRLPGKVMADFLGQPMLGYMLSRVKQAKHLDGIVVATTTNDTDDVVAEFCSRHGVGVFRGDEQDVLGRYASCARIHPAEQIVRLTADCPFADPTLIDKSIELLRDGGFDYVSNCVERTYPDGLDVEAMLADVLFEADKNADSPLLREHVTPYIRGVRPDLGAGQFNIGHLLFDADFSWVRWTVDTAGDLVRARRLAELGGTRVGWLQLLSCAAKERDLLGPAP